MRKKLAIVLFVLVLAISACFSVGAAEKEFGDFTVEVPDGWTAREEGTAVTIRAEDGSAIVTVILDTTGAMSLKETAEAFMKELGGDNLRFEAGVYRFAFKNAQEMDSVMLISGAGKTFTAVAIAGEHPEVEKIVDSLKAK